MGKRTNTAQWMANQSRWQIKVQKDNERRTFTSSAPGRTGQREANAKADAWLDDGIDQTSCKIDALYTKYIANLKDSTGRSHYANVESRYKNHIKPHIGNHKISSVTEQHLQNIINKAHSTRNADQRLSAKSLSNLRGDISGFYKFCRKSHVTKLNPENLTIPAGAAPSQKSILQPSDIIKLFNCDTIHLQKNTIKEPYINAYRFAVLTGLRPGEINGLRWEDVQKDIVHIKRAINEYGEVTSGKNHNAIRAVPLSALAVNVLEAQRAITGNEQSVFCISSLQTYNKRWGRFCIENGIPKTTPYEMRHTFVSVTKTLPAGQVKNLVGHSQNMDTFGIYGHEINGEDEKTAQDLNQLFNHILTQKA